MLEDLESDLRGALLAAANAQMTAEAFAHLAPSDAADVIGHVGPERMATILDLCPPDVAADVLRRLDWEEAGPVLGQMTARKAIGDLLLYQDDEAGGLMSPRVVALRDSWPAAHGINVLRYSGLDHDELRQLFAVDENNVLVGLLDLPELVFAPPGSTVSDVMSAGVLLTELALAIGQGLVVSAILVGIVWAWRGDSYLALVVAGALLVNMLVAALGGVLVPLLLRAVRIDPATSSAVFVTTLTDVSGIVLYLGLATAMLSVLKPG